ncbi:hypothetical protein KSS87_009203 [Heliosperma pusillum]|nr:hypothetical protein KSS87_009203 [Heliosperma pusillum]
MEEFSLIYLKMEELWKSKMECGNGVWKREKEFRN